MAGPPPREPRLRVLLVNDSPTQRAALRVALALEPVTIRQWGIRGMMYAKLIAICCLIAFQITRFPGEIRLAALKGMSRLLPSIVVFGVGLAATTSLDTWPRGGVVAALVAATALATRTVSFAELKALKTMRIT